VVAVETMLSKHQQSSANKTANVVPELDIVSSNGWLSVLFIVKFWQSR
jgi:hypothetical protein